MKCEVLSCPNEAGTYSVLCHVCAARFQAQPNADYGAWIWRENTQTPEKPKDWVVTTSAHDPHRGAIVVHDPRAQPSQPSPRNLLEDYQRRQLEAIKREELDIIRFERVLSHHIGVPPRTCTCKPNPRGGYVVETEVPGVVEPCPRGCAVPGPGALPVTVQLRQRFWRMHGLAEAFRVVFGVLSPARKWLRVPQAEAYRAPAGVDQAALRVAMACAVERCAEDLDAMFEAVCRYALDREHDIAATRDLDICETCIALDVFRAYDRALLGSTKLGRPPRWSGEGRPKSEAPRAAGVARRFLPSENAETAGRSKW